MEKRRLTIFTSNYSMEELKQRLCAAASKSSEPVAAERLLERIRALSCEIFIKGETRTKIMTSKNCNIMVIIRNVKIEDFNR